MRSAILVAATFLASAVEMVEALTIVLAAAYTRGWHSVRLGIAAALAALAVVVALLGPALTLLPIEALRVVVGFLLLTLGLQWLRKALLRAAAYIPSARRGADLRTRGASRSRPTADPSTGGTSTRTRSPSPSRVSSSRDSKSRSSW